MTPEFDGPVLEGVLRNWAPSRAPGEDGALRDSAVYAITDAEWPACRTALEARVAAAAQRRGGVPRTGR